jgi:three-Cys-motif partner protein
MPGQKQGNLFADLPPPAGKPLRFKPQQRPLWTENKARLIERYLFYFVLVTKHGAYIDGFAAPQDPDNLDSWACKLVLESKPQFLREFWLCDVDKQGFNALNRLVEEVPKPRGRKVTVVLGDFNFEVHSILRDCDIRESTASFCLLDQRTFECTWETVRTLAGFKKKGHKIELFYFLASGWLDRSLKGTTKNVHQIERWWGNSDWTKLRGMKLEPRAQLLTERFRKELGYAHAYAWRIYDRGSGGRVMYHMIHATDHPEAPKLMNRAYFNATKAREPIEKLQMDLAELWGSLPSDQSN